MKGVSNALLGAPLSVQLMAFNKLFDAIFVAGFDDRTKATHEVAFFELGSVTHADPRGEVFDLMSGPAEGEVSESLIAQRDGFLRSLSPIRRGRRIIEFLQ